VCRGADASDGQPTLMDALLAPWMTTPLGGFLLFVAVGFLAQLVDGALGMAYGVISTTVLLTLGVPPVQATAMVHTAEIFTTGASGAAHAWRRNVDWSLVARLAPAGAIGGIAGALVVTSVPVHILRPFVAGWLALMGVVMVLAALRGRFRAAGPPKGVIPLGLAGGFLDASGGGGWGPVVTTSLISSGQTPRTTIGSVSVSEFLVTTAVAAAFAMTIGLGHMGEVAGLVVGGVLAAPLAATIVRAAPTRLLMGLVGVLVVALSIWQLALAFDAAWRPLVALAPDWLRPLLEGR
jgi:uncharacterized protein